MDVEVHKISQLRHSTRIFVEGAQMTKEVNEAQETTILANYAKAHRKYPVGHPFTYCGDLCTLGRSLAYFDADHQVIVICYAVLCCGIEIDTIKEIHVDNPHDA